MLGFVRQSEYDALEDKVRILTLVVKEFMGEERYAQIESQFMTLSSSTLEAIDTLGQDLYNLSSDDGEPVSVSVVESKIDTQFIEAEPVIDHERPGHDSPTQFVPPTENRSSFGNKVPETEIGISAKTASQGLANLQKALIDDDKRSNTRVLADSVKKRLNSDIKAAKERRKKAREMFREGKTVKQIMKSLKASETTVRRYIKGARRRRTAVK